MCGTTCWTASAWSRPDTWEDLYNHMFDLHQNNLDIGLPSITDDTLDVFYMLLFQRDGALYNDDLSATRLGPSPEE